MVERPFGPILRQSAWAAFESALLTPRRDRAITDSTPPASLTHVPVGYADWLADLMYIRAFTEAWPDAEIVQQPVGQVPWGYNLVLLTRLPSIEQIKRELGELP